MNNISQYSKDSLILIDNEFAKENITGIEIAKQLHNMGFSKLYLFSGRDYSHDSSIPAYLTPVLKTDVNYILNLLKR